MLPLWVGKNWLEDQFQAVFPCPKTIANKTSIEKGLFLLDECCTTFFDMQKDRVDARHRFKVCPSQFSNDLNIEHRLCENRELCFTRAARKLFGRFLLYDQIRCTWHRRRVENLAYDTCCQVVRYAGKDFVFFVGNIVLQDVIGYDLDIVYTLKSVAQSPRKGLVFFNGNDFTSDLGQLSRNDPTPRTNLVDKITRLDRACIE